MTDEKAVLKAARLKAALRDNLRRRKAQARGRTVSSTADGDPVPGEPTPGGPDSAKTGL